MSTKTKLLKKKVTEYEYSVIKNQIGQKKIAFHEWMPSFSKKNINFPKMKNMFSNWMMDQRIALIREKEKENTKRQLFLQNQKQKEAQEVIWVGNESISLQYAILYLIFENLKPSKTKRLSQEKKIVLKHLLYNISECYFTKEEKQTFVEGMCLLQYYTSSLSQFFFKHDSFQKICLKMISLVSTHSKEKTSDKEYQKIQAFSEEINSYLQNDIKQIFSSLDKVMKIQPLYQNQLGITRDYVLKIVLLNEKVSYLINQKSCLFIFQNNPLCDFVEGISFENTTKNNSHNTTLMKASPFSPRDNKTDLLAEYKGQIKRLFKNFANEEEIGCSTGGMTENSSNNAQNSGMSPTSLLKVKDEKSYNELLVIKTDRNDEYFKNRLSVFVQSINCSFNEESEIDSVKQLATDRKSPLKLQNLLREKHQKSFKINFNNKTPTNRKKVPQFLATKSKNKKDWSSSSKNLNEQISQSPQKPKKKLPYIKSDPQFKNLLQPPNKYNSQKNSPFKRSPLNSPRAYPEQKHRIQ